MKRSLRSFMIVSPHFKLHDTEPAITDRASRAAGMTETFGEPLCCLLLANTPAFSAACPARKKRGTTNSSSPRSSLTCKIQPRQSSRLRAVVRDRTTQPRDHAPRRGRLPRCRSDRPKARFCWSSGNRRGSCSASFKHSLALGVGGRASQCLGRINLRSFLRSLLVVVGKGSQLIRNRTIGHGFCCA